MNEIKGLPYDLNKKLSYAISQGYLRDYEADPRTWKHSFVGSYLRKYPDHVKILDTLSAIVGGMPDWSDLDDDVLRDFVDDLRESGIAPSSVKTFCSEVKALLNANKKKLPDPSSDFSSILSVRGSTSQAVYLTADETDAFLSYNPRTPIERYVHRNFAVQLLTGARVVDARQLTVHNCDLYTGMMSYVPKKTPGIVVSVPIDERRGLMRFLSLTPSHTVHKSVYNSTVRDICREVGIDTVCTIMKAGKNVTEPKWRLVSSHTARRSFATNLYLAGASLEDVAVLMGHGKNITTTKRYICAERKISSSVMAYFQPQLSELNTNNLAI